MNRLVASLVILLCANDLVAPASAWQIAIDTVPVGNAGNAPDTVIMSDGTTGYGAVNYDYQIGTYEVTNAQYAAFLNAKAKSDPLGLYQAGMASLGHPEWGGITRSGADGSYSYALIPGRENKPVALVNWYDAARFANWLNNGQGNGDTETGAYTILGGTPLPSNGPSIVRNPGATWFLPSENEWYKAAFYNPDTSSYFAFPTNSNTPPTAEAPVGGSNSANHNQGYAGDFTDVGAYTGTKSPYGAFDMAGNAWEWNEAVFAGGWRGLRGSSFLDISPAFLLSSFRGSAVEWGENGHVGFRVATIPEPSTLALVGIGLAALLGSRVVHRRRGFNCGSIVCLVVLVACLGLTFCDVRVAKAQSQLTTRVDIYNSSTDAWSTAELSQARANLAAVSAGGKALFAGGGASLPFASDRVDLFDSTTGQWSTSSLSQPRIAIAATSVGDLALFGGGYNGQGQGLSSVDIYDAAKDQWTQSSFSVPRVAGAATTVGDRALFAGGSVDLSYTTTDVVDIYDSAAGQWTSAHLSQPRALLAATTAGGKAFFAGGYNQAKGISDVVDIYDSATDQWSVAHLSEPRSQLVAATVGSKAFFAGGNNLSGAGSAVVDIYDTDTGQWSVASLSQSRYTLAATALGDKAYFAGGTSKDDGSTSYDIVDVYDGNTGLWSVDHLSQDHHYLGGTAVGDLVLFGGGYTLVPEPATVELAAVALLGLLGFVGLRRCRRQTPALLAALVAAWLVSAPAAWADILRWDNGQVIPGTEGITPGPGMQLSAWNTDGHNLRYADFSAGLDLSGAHFPDNWLDYAHFQGANLSHAILARSTLTNANLTGANLANAGLNGSTLTNANLTGAVVTGTVLGSTGFTSTQLYSTQSYAAKDLSGIRLDGNDLTGWDFREQNLANAGFYGFHGDSSSNLTNANLTGANLVNADFLSCTLTSANLTGAVVTGSRFGDTTSRGFTAAQLYSTQSYVAKDLSGIRLGGNDLTGWDFHEQNLAYASMAGSTLTNANLTGAVVTGARLDQTGLTAAQLYSTQSYAAKDLSGIGLGPNLTGWDFHEQNLANAGMALSTLTNANLTGANLAYARLNGSTLTNANLTGANLANADFFSSTITNANVTGADTRGAVYARLTEAILKKTILPNGTIAGLDLAAGEQLVVRDDDGVSDPPPEDWLTPRSPIPVTVQDHLTMAVGGTLELRFDSDPWNSLISFQAGIPVNLGGTLELTFAKGVDPVSQLGHTLHVFDWSGVSPTGAFTVSSLYDWDASGLYSSGVVTLLAAGGAVAGDADGNGKVEMADFDILKTHFGDPGAKSEGDANGDGRIDLNDFGLLKANFGKSAAAVPEPASAILAVLAALSFVGVRRCRRQTPARLAALAIATWLVAAPTARADIFRWDNHELIPGTEGITPGPGVQLSNWNTDEHNLRFAELSSGPGGPELDISLADFSGSWLDNAVFVGTFARGANFQHASLTHAQMFLASFWEADLSGANLTSAVLGQTMLAAANLSGANLENCSLSGADLSNANLSNANLDGAGLFGAILTGTKFANATVAHAGFGDTTSHGFTREQLYATRSYQTRDLRGIELGYNNDLSGWNLSGQDLSDASMQFAHFEGADFAGATLKRAALYDSVFTDAKLSGANLTNANLSGTVLTRAVVSGANFSGTTSVGLGGLTKGQLYSTLSYQQGDLAGVGLSANDLTDWDFASQNLTNADLSGSTLAGANLSGASLGGANLSRSTLANANLTSALVAGADFHDTTSRGFTKDQFYATRSYQEMLPNPFEGYRQLAGIGLSSNDLSGWVLWRSNLTSANLAEADLAGADLQRSILFFANLRGADLTGANLMSTRIGGANLSGANCINANLGFLPVTYYDVDLSFADLRGAANLPDDVPLPPHVNSLRSSILPSGVVAGLELAAGERLVVHDDDGVPDPAPTGWLTARPPIPVRIQDHLTMADGGVLELQFDADPWDSLISFAPGIPVQLGGALDLTFAKGADPAPQVGHTLHVFDWSGVSPTGAFTVSSLYDWDTSGLYTTGVVTLLAAGGVIAGDSNADGKVDLADFGTLKDHFGAPGAKSDGDANGDGRIDLNDFGLLKVNFGKSAPGNVAVPEPATWVLAIMGGVWLAAGRVGRRRHSAGLVIAALLLAAPSLAEAQILRWDNGQVIPGTEGITPGPGVDLSGWYTEGHRLSWADLAGGLDLTGANLSHSWFESAHLDFATLVDANIAATFLYNVSLTNANLERSNLTEAGLFFTDLANANLADADLRNAYCEWPNLQSANLAGALITGIRFYTGFSGTPDQFYSTASYQTKDLHGVAIPFSNLAGWDFSGQNLTGADLGGSTLTDAKLNAAVVTGANLSGITQGQLASTASYQAKALQGIGLYGTDLSGLDLSDQNLTSADLSYSALNHANLSGANLTGANLKSSNLTNSNLSGTNLAGADLSAASFTGAAVAGADFSATQLSRDQLYSTASYQAHELQGIGLPFHDLRGWNLQGQNLTEANLAAANLMGANLVDVIGSHAKLSAANLTLADLRAAQELDLRGTDTRNAILPDGKIAGLELAAGERLVVRNQSTPIGIHNDVNLASTTCTLELQFDSEPWTSGIAFSPGIPVQLGGRLELAFAAGVDVDSQLGRTFKIFDWSGVAPQGHFDVGGPYLWDASRLYTSGEVTLVAPEPTALTLTLAGLSIIALAMLRRWRACRAPALLFDGSRA